MTRIVVGIDGSPGSARALAWAIEEARHRNAILTAVHAWSVPSPVVGAAGVGMVPVPDTDRDALEASSAAVLDEALAALPADVECERVAAEGPPVEALVSTAQAGDLIVVGTRGHGDLASFVLGSVSHECARRAPCPVVVVPDR
jgi:nucleotide-binding universal stress UspA family protein